MSEKTVTKPVVILPIGAFIGLTVWLCRHFLTPAGPSMITYRITGTAPSVDITYLDAKANRREVVSKLPWEISSEFKLGDTVYLYGLNLGGSGKMQATIAADGRDWKTESSGDYAVVNVTGMVGDE